MPPDDTPPDDATREARLLVPHDMACVRAGLGFDDGACRCIAFTRERVADIAAALRAKDDEIGELQEHRNRLLRGLDAEYVKAQAARIAQLEADNAALRAQLAEAKEHAKRAEREANDLWHRLHD